MNFYWEFLTHPSTVQVEKRFLLDNLRSVHWLQCLAFRLNYILIWIPATEVVTTNLRACNLWQQTRAFSIEYSTDVRRNFIESRVWNLLHLWASVREGRLYHSSRGRWNLLRTFSSQKINQNMSKDEQELRNQNRISRLSVAKLISNWFAAFKRNNINNGTGIEWRCRSNIFAIYFSVLRVERT